MLKSADAAHPPARPAIFLACAVVAMALSPALSKAELLYFTEFENPPFIPGPDNWAGSGGWLANSNGLGVHGIDDDQSIGTDQTAFLGFNQPDTGLVVVAKTINHDPAKEGSVSIQIDASFGIQDSLNEFRDSFFLTIYNISGKLLGALRLSNELATFGIWRYDGVTDHDTGLAFIHGEPHLWCIEIDFQNNLWKVDMDGIPIFVDAPFTATANSRTLGSLAYEWQLNSGNLSEHGDNWMLVADTAIWAIPPGEPNFTIDQVGPDSGGQPQIEFTGEPGWSYQVQYTDNLLLWLQDLPSSTFTGIPEITQIQFSDSTPNPPARRWYRVMRSVTP